jgi:hypothetical protein
MGKYCPHLPTIQTGLERKDDRCILSGIMWSDRVDLVGDAVDQRA